VTSYQHLFLIDECLPPDLIDKYLEQHLSVTEIKAQMVHFVDKYGRNGKWPDSRWVPDLARDPKWIVLTADSGKQSTKTACLRRLCRKHAVRLIWISSAIQDKGIAFYGPQFLTHFPKIIEFGSAPRGIQAQIRLYSENSTRTQLDLVECPNGFTYKDGLFLKCQPVVTGKAGA